jgi:hypothetical protein
MKHRRSSRSRRNAMNRNRRKRFARGRKKKPIIEKSNGETEPVPDRLKTLQEHVWNAMGVASCIEYGSYSSVAYRSGRPDFGSAAEAIYFLLNIVAFSLEKIIDELGGVTEEEEDDDE